MKPLYLMAGVLWAFSQPLTAATGSQGTKLPLLPLDGLYPEAINICFPGLLNSGGSNAAALGRFPKVNAIGAAFTPRFDNQTQGYFGGFATSKKNLGFGAGVEGLDTSGTSQHSAFAAVGVGFDKVSLGLAIRETNLSGDFTPNVDMGLIIGEQSGLRGALTLYHIDSSARVAVGVGYAKSKAYTIEANVRLPNLNDLGGNYLITVAANLAVDPLAVHFATHYFTSGGWSHALGVSFWLGEAFNLQAQFNSPNTVSLGLLFAF